MTLRIAEKAKDLPCVLVYIRVKKSEGNRDYYYVCTVTGTKKETIPNLVTRLKLSPQGLCSEVIVDSLSSFLDGTVFACRDLQISKLRLNKVLVVRYETEDVQTKNIKRGRLYLPANCTSSVKPDDAYVIRFNSSKTSKSNSLS